MVLEHQTEAAPVRTAEVMQAHNQRMQQRLAGSVWSLCRSWYRTDSGRIVAIFPGFTSEYVKSLRRFYRDDYLFG